MIAVAGGKGGCGKTTTTAGLARSLAATGADPVAVDADVDMPNLHVVADVRRDPGLDALAEGTPLAAVAQSSLALPGVRVVASGSGGSTSQGDALAPLQSLDRPVLVDTPAGASPAVATPLRFADATLVVTTPTRESLADAAKTAAMARTLDAPVIAVVVTRSDGRVDPASLLECESIRHVPPVEEPLTDTRVRRRYDAIASTLSERNI